MFGFITPYLNKLSQEEKNRYQGIYCGLCHSLRDNYNNLSRLCLSYDLTFLILLLSSLYEPIEQSEFCNCIFHPGKKYYIYKNEFSNYAADLTVALAYHKILDNINDENSLKSKIGKTALLKQYENVTKKIPKLCFAIEEAMKQITQIENQTLKLSLLSTLSDKNKEFVKISGDEISKVFGTLLAVLFNPKKSIWNTQLGVLGANLGRFIYFTDAAVDLEKDLKTDNYNPYKYFSYTKKYIKNNHLINKEAFGKEVKNELMNFIGIACSSFEKLPLDQDLNLLREILYEGVWVSFNHHFFSKNKDVI